MMIKVNKYFASLIYIVVTASALTFINSIASHKAYAFSTTTPITNVAPAADSANISVNGATQQPWFSVGRGQYDGNLSQAKVYVPVGSGATVTIQRGGGDCTGSNGNDIDQGGRPNVTFFLYSLDAQDKPDFSYTNQKFNYNFADCAPIPLTINSGNGTPSAVTGHEGYRVFYLQVQMNNPVCTPPSPCNEAKDFRVSVDNGGFVGASRNVVTTDAHTFGLRMISAAATPYNWDYAVQFAPLCNDTVSAQQTLQIYDIDYKDYKTAQGGDLYPYQDANIRALIDQDNRANATYSWGLVSPPGYFADPTSPGLTSERLAKDTDWSNVEHSFNPLTIGKYSLTQRYLFEFRALDYRNVLQIRLPFDQFDSRPSVGQACTSSATCVATPNPASIAQGASSAINVVGTINSGQWPSTYYLERTGPNYRQITTAGNNNGTDNVTPSSTTTYTYVIYDSRTGGQAANSTSCKATVTVNKPPPPPGGGVIDSTCEQTKVSLGNITATSAGVQIRVVPVAIQITDVNTNTLITTYVVPGGVPNSGSKTFNTFDMYNGMWPHGSYKVQLFVQGAGGSPDSPTYPNDGSWFQPGGNMNGPFWYPSNIIGFNTDNFSDCLSASCVSGTGPVVEPGNNTNANYTVHFDNDAGRSSGWATNDPNGYNFTASTSGGLVLLSSNPQATSSGINPWNGGTSGVPVGTDVSVNIQFREDWRGSYSITLRYQANNLSLPPSNQVITCQGPIITPQTKPYFKVTQGDLNTGGGFGASSTGLCTVGDPGYIGPKTPGYDNYAGGIRAYANQSAALGSSGDFGVLALGYNIGSSSGPAGLYSKDNAIFAQPSTTPGFMGGLLNPTAASPSAWHCVNDFFLKTRKSNPTDLGANPTINVDNLSTLQYTATGSVTITSGGCSAAGNVPQGRQPTIYVDGNVLIDNDICYAQNYDATNRSNVPYFALIVQGNVTVKYSVKQLDGLYVVQPHNSSDGIFDTCDGFCPNNTLTVNGAVVAQYVYLSREHGTVGPLSADLNGITTQPAEVFNYTPAMIIGQPNFSPEYSNIQAIFSLPPVF